LLNQYAGAILSAIRGHEGDVLKLIGDGTLDIFTRRTGPALVMRHSPPLSKRAALLPLTSDGRHPLGRRVHEARKVLDAWSQ